MKVKISRRFLDGEYQVRISASLNDQPYAVFLHVNDEGFLDQFLAVCTKYTILSNIYEKGMQITSDNRYVRHHEVVRRFKDEETATRFEAAIIGRLESLQSDLANQEPLTFEVDL